MSLVQFVVFIQEWLVLIPANAKALLKYMKTLALMEFIDSQQLTKPLSKKLGFCEECDFD